MGLGQPGAVVGHQAGDLDDVGVAVVGACGLVLISGFSLGLASVLTSLGVAVGYGQQ